jgi:hypothetical protein
LSSGYEQTESYFPTCTKPLTFTARQDTPMVKLLFTSFFLIILKVAIGQYTICDCCSASLYYKSNIEDSVFNASLIKSNKITELTVFTTSQKMTVKAKDMTYAVVDKEYKELIFRFNSQGLVVKKTVFNRLGQFHSVYDYTRDASGRVVKIVFHYLDSLGVPDENFLVETKDYYYTGNYLSKIKQRDDKQNTVPDDKSGYEAFDYDNKGRVIKATYYTYYDWTKPMNFYRATSYNDSLNRSVTKTFDNKRLFTTENVLFDKYKNPTLSRLLDKSNKLLRENQYTYDNNNRLIKHTQKSYPGMGTECPDGGNFINIYSYNSSGLLDKIQHKFKTIQCLLIFDWR